MLKISLLIGAGGFLGSISRYWLSLFLDRHFTGAYPIGTFTVNIIGCFLLGLIYAVAEHSSFISPDTRLFLAAGFCGSFTTFSTFAFESQVLIKDGHWPTMASYIVASIVLGVIATFVGVAAGRAV